MAYVQPKAPIQYEPQTKTVEVEGHTLTVTLVRKVGSTKPPLLSMVRNQYGGVLWSFKEAKYDGIARLEWIGDTPVIVLVYLTSKEVEWAIPLAELVGIKPREWVRLLLKLYVADVVGCKPFISEDERPLMAELLTGRRADETFYRQLLEQQDAEKRAERARERLAKSQKIQTRPAITVEKSGFAVAQTGVPCVDREWECMPDGTRVVLVESLDEATGTVGQVLEHFVVRKVNGKNPSKDFCASARLAKVVESLKPKKGLVTLAVGEKKRARTVVVNPSDDQLAALRRHAPTTGLLIARGEGLKGIWPIYQIGKDGPEQPLGRHSVSISSRA